MSDLWSYVPPTLISTLISASVGYVTAKKASRKAEWSSRADDLGKDIRSLSEDVRRYWSSNLQPPELVALSVAIKTRLHDIGEQLHDIGYTHDLVPFRSEYLERLNDESWDLATGGDFESPNRAVDVQRAHDAALKLDEFRREVMICKQRSI